MDKLKYVKLENPDGSYSDNIPLAVDSNYVSVGDSNLTTELELKATKTELNSAVSNLSTVISSLAEGSPAGVYATIAALTTADPDHSKIYVVTTDGHWYYYNNGWQDGGVYQATEILDGSITYESLDNNLNNLFIKNIDFITKENPVVGYKIANVNDEISIASDSNYKYYKIDISSYIGKTLFYAIGTFQNTSTLFLADENDNIIYNTPKNTTGTSFIRESGNIPLVSGMKYLYLSCNKNLAINDTYYNIGVYNNFLNTVDYTGNTIIPPLSSVDGFYIHKTNTVVNSTPKFTALQNYTVKIYKAYKGAKYNITGVNKYNACAFILIDNNQVVYTKSTDLYDQDVSFNYDFICQKEGFIYITTSPSNEMNTTVSIYDKIKESAIASSNNLGVVKVGDTLEINGNGVLNVNVSSYMSNYKVGFTGDSICKGNGYNGGYAKILHDTYGLQVQNIGVSGGHITDDEITPFVISNSIDDLDNDCDAYIIEGGINDYNAGVNFGEITGAFTSTIDQTTFCGALEKICRDLYTYHPGKHYAFLIVHNVLISYYDKKNGKTFMDFRNAIYDICNKYSIDVIDIAKNESMLTYYQDIRENYTMQYQGSGDGLHPNQAGYTKFYVPEIKAWLDKIFKL